MEGACCVERERRERSGRSVHEGRDRAGERCAPRGEASSGR